MTPAAPSGAVPAPVSHASWTPPASSAPPTTAGDTAVPEGAPGIRRRHIDWRIRFAALCLLWGFSFLFIKVGTEGYAPFQVTLGRMVCGTVVLMAVLALKRERLPRGLRLWGHLTVATLLLCAAPFSLFAYAELTISSALAGICNATTPLWSMVLSLAALSEDRPTRRRVAGLGIGFAGVLVVLGVWQGFAGQDPAGAAMALGGALSYAIGWLYVRRTLTSTGHSPLSLTGCQLLLSTMPLAVLAALFTSAPAAFPVLPLLAVLALGTLGTGLGFVLQYGLVAETGPTTATMVTYFVPVIATAAGVLLLGERLTWNVPVGALVILAGAALSRGGGRSRRS